MDKLVLVGRGVIMTKMHWCPNAWSDVRCGKTVFYNYNRCLKQKPYTCERCGNSFSLECLGECNTITGQLATRKRKQEFANKYYKDSMRGVEENLFNQAKKNT